MKQDTKKLALIGYACDEGVRRNRGRVGAQGGPAAIRKCLPASLDLEDYGDVVCQGHDMESAQAALGLQVARALKEGYIPLVIGGGHDVAYGHYLGLHEVIKGSIGILNFDAHFDLRPFHEGGNSGTPFHQISALCASEGRPFHYLPIGIRASSNSDELFKTAERLGVTYIPMEVCHPGEIDVIKQKVNAFTEAVDHVYLSIDLDGFSSEYAPGVSAASAHGFLPGFVMEMVDHIMANGKVISCDLAEMNPVFDEEERTARLAVTLIERMRAALALP